jgi:hypothetical protein
MVNQAFIQQVKQKAHVASQILLYDRVVIPTHDFGIVAALANWLGEDVFIEALDTDTFTFVKPKGLLGYVGNGHGINEYSIEEGVSSRPFTWWQIALFKDPLQAIAAQVENLCSNVSPHGLEQIVRKAVAHCSLAQYGNETFIRAVEDETYFEIQQSSALSNRIRAAVGGASSIDLKRLPGLGPNQIRASVRDESPDAIDLVLRIAEVHRDLLMASDSGIADLYVPSGTEVIVTQKFGRLRSQNARSAGFLNILDLNNLPDIAVAITSGMLQMPDVWCLRQTREARAFRQWLQQATPSDGRDLERLYMSALNSSPRISSLPVRALRFLVTTAVGLADPLGGIVIDGVDSFLTERWLRGYSPKFFIDRYRDMLRP